MLITPSHKVLDSSEDEDGSEDVGIGSSGDGHFLTNENRELKLRVGFCLLRLTED